MILLEVISTAYNNWSVEEYFIMTDRLYPLNLESMARWIHDELLNRDSVFGIGRNLFFNPHIDDPFRTTAFGHSLHSPVGVAAGPHTQMAQNIVAAWLCGARFIELKTIQTLDELSVSKPCIDMEDAGYNVEWSQELRVRESISEYINAWILIHALHRKLNFPGDGPGAVFNLSAGYNMDGIRKPNVQLFLDTMRDARPAIDEGINTLSAIWPELKSLEVPHRISDNITLSTMHGCPPDEIGTICRYMLEERGLHTYVKLNPTLLGPDLLRSILNEQLGYRDVSVPDEAFGHDIKFDDAVKLIRELRGVAQSRGLSFGVKLSNTLEVINHRRVFSPQEKQMYLSGRPLHALTVNLAKRLQDVFDGELDVSFAGGADAFNLPQLMACGMKTVTVCSDLLRSGGYTRLAQYHQQLRSTMAETGASSIDAFIRATAKNNKDPVNVAARKNLTGYALQVLENTAYRAETFDRTGTKSLRPLGKFDCIKAPCTEVCPVAQQVPHYMRFVKTGRYEDAARVVKRDNTMPAILGRACHHPCHARCVRTHLDHPVEIREIKRFIMDHASISSQPAHLRDESVAIIGAGPCGLATADFLSRAGYPVTLFDARDQEGGMVSSSIPGYRASNDALKQDTAFLAERGVEIRHGMTAGKNVDVDDLKKEGFSVIVVATGAQNAGTLGLSGEQVTGIWDSLRFLRECREGRPPAIGQHVGVVGGGDVAMDCARTAWRLGADNVSIIYRRTRREMPAQYEELHGLLNEKIPVRELLAPKEVLSRDGRLTGLVCSVMELGEPDASGRRRPRPVEGKSEHIQLDTLIVAINQSGDFTWLQKHKIQLNDHGYIEVDPATHETSMRGVYAGGDAIGEGPATIVKALGDGKRIARAIRLSFEGFIPEEPPLQDLPHPDRFSLQIHRAFRSSPQPVPERAPQQRRDFTEVVETMDVAAARLEAARCLDCDVMCSYCVGVCPNLALFTYECDPMAVNLPKGCVRDGRWFTLGGEKIDIAQSYQVAVFADFCNECGNCTTFCPSAGKPYQDKPRIYRHVAEFTHERDNAFMILRGEKEIGILARYDGRTHVMKINGTMTYESPELHVEWKKDWTIISLEVKTHAPDREQVSLKPAVEMAALLNGMVRSMPFFPVLGEDELRMEDAI